MDEQADVVVVGAGTAAFQAAVAAREAGARRVVVLEKSPARESGGNARFSPTMFRFTHAGVSELRTFLSDMDEAAFARLRIPPYSAESYFHDLQANSHYRMDPELAQAIVDGSNSGMYWMLSHGFEWQLAEEFRHIDGLDYYEPGFVLGVRGGGIAQLERWQRVATELGIVIRYESPVQDIYVRDGIVNGVRIRNSAGDRSIIAPAVILCSGGYQASTEQRARYLGTNADLMRLQGSPHDTGEVLHMALNAGAASSGHWQAANASAVDGTYPALPDSWDAYRHSHRFGILVNHLGARFLDEGACEPSEASVGRGIEWDVLEQPGGICFQIFDATVKSLLDPSYDKGGGFTAYTVGELAQQIEIDSVLLERTISEFNRAVNDEVPFDSTRPDGRGTDGIAPAKTNWANRIEVPPFFAYPVTAGITFSFGGLKINKNAEVLNTTGAPIQGLFASGDVIGLYYNHHLRASGQMRNVVFSRVAGKLSASLKSD